MKKALYAVAVIATVAIAGWNYQQNKEKVELSDLALENVEALANTEDRDADCLKADGQDCQLIISTPNGNWIETHHNYKNKFYQALSLI